METPVVALGMRRLVPAVVLAALLLLLGLAMARPAAADNDYLPLADESLVQLFLPDQDALDRARSGEGYDFAEYLDKQDDGRLRADRLRHRRGARRPARPRLRDRRDDRVERRRARSGWPSARSSMAQEELAGDRAENGRPQGRARSHRTHEVTLQRADYFTNYAGRFLSVEAFSNLATRTTGTMSLSYTSDGTTYSAPINMPRFDDPQHPAQVYMYHRVLVRIAAGAPDADARPRRVRLRRHRRGRRDRVARRRPAAARRRLPDRTSSTATSTPQEAYARIEAAPHAVARSSRRSSELP